MLGAEGLAVLDGLQFVLAGAEAELFGASAGDDELFAIHKDLDIGVIDFDHQRAIAADDANHGGGEVRYARGLAEYQSGSKEKEECGRDGPAPASQGSVAHCWALPCDRCGTGSRGDNSHPALFSCYSGEEFATFRDRLRRSLWAIAV